MAGDSEKLALEAATLLLQVVLILTPLSTIQEHMLLPAVSNTHTALLQPPAPTEPTLPCPIWIVNLGPPTKQTATRMRVVVTSLVVLLLLRMELILRAHTPVQLNPPTLIKECFLLRKDSVVLQTPRSLIPISRL